MSDFGTLLHVPTENCSLFTATPIDLLRATLYDVLPTPLLPLTYSLSFSLSHTHTQTHTHTDTHTHTHPTPPLTHMHTHTQRNTRTHTPTYAHKHTPLVRAPSAKLAILSLPVGV